VNTDIDLSNSTSNYVQQGVQHKSTSNWI